MKEKEEIGVFDPEVYEFSKDAKLEKHNAIMENTLIEARYSLTVEEQRLVLATIAMLGNVETASSGFPTLRIPKKLIIKATNMHEKDYKIIRISLERLMSRVIRIETEKGFELYQWFAKAKYNKGEDFIEVQFHPDLKPYLLKLKERFTKIPLKQVLKLRSKYAIRLYELLKRYEDTGFRTDYLLDLRRKLGVEDKVYSVFADFEKKVLKRAVKEINEKTDLEVSYKKKKTGRKITHIEFTIKTKPKVSNDKDKKGILEETKVLNVGDTPKLTKTPSETLDNQALYKEKNLQGEIVKKGTQKNEKNIWEIIGDYRKEYRDILDDIKSDLSRLTENQVLFLLINADRSVFTPNILKEIIINADRNKNLHNPMGYLVKVLNIDMSEAKFKELTLTAKKIDEELLKKKLEELFVSGKSAKKYMQIFWNSLKDKENLTKKNKKALKEALFLLREPLRSSVYDDFENKIYIPVPDDVYKEWFETNWLDRIKGFMREKFDIEDVVLINLSD